MWQANHVAQLLCQVEPELDVVMVPSDTFADLDLKRSIAELGGKGAFSKEIQQVVVAGHADIAVHSAKDLQALTPEGLTVAAYPTRGDARDALVGITLEQLAAQIAAGEEPVLASGSNRRRALLLERCPEVGFVDLRGNIATRLARLDPTAGSSADPAVDGLIMAAVALERLGLDTEVEVLEPLDPGWFVPQVGQGALAVETPSDNRELRALIGTIDDPLTRLAVEAERSFLAELGGDCTLPAGAHATVAAGDRRVEISIQGVLADADHRHLQRHTEIGTVDTEPGRVLARTLRKALEAATS